MPRPEHDLSQLGPVAQQLLSLLSLEDPVVLTADTNLSDDWSYRVITDFGSSAIRTWTFPPAVAGLGFILLRECDFPTRYQPNGSEIVGEAGAGKYVYLVGRGFLFCECIRDGRWDVTGGSQLYDTEN